MKRGEILLVLITILMISPVLAETTFFEGDSGYGDDFIMANLPPAIVAAVSEGAQIGETSTGGFFLKQTYNTSEVCVYCYEDLKQHIQETRKINYSEQDVILLATEINTELKTDLSNNQVRYIIENFEDECNMQLPLLGGFASGRSTDLLSPLLLIISIILLVGIILIGFLIIRALKRKRSRKKVKRHKK